MVSDNTPTSRYHGAPKHGDALLAGLLGNALFGWWWADPAAALVIGAVAAREGRESWSAEGCCDVC